MHEEDLDSINNLDEEYAYTYDLDEEYARKQTSFQELAYICLLYTSPSPRD